MEKKGFLTTKEASQMLGYSVGTLYQLVHRNAIPYHKVGVNGRSLRFKQEDLMEYLNGKRVEAKVSNV